MRMLRNACLCLKQTSSRSTWRAGGAAGSTTRWHNPSEAISGRRPTVSSCRNCANTSQTSAERAWPDVEFLLVVIIKPSTWLTIPMLIGDKRESAWRTHTQCPWCIKNIPYQLPRCSLSFVSPIDVRHLALIFFGGRSLILVLPEVEPPRLEEAHRITSRGVWLCRSVWPSQEIPLYIFLVPEHVSFMPLFSSNVSAASSRLSFSLELIRNNVIQCTFVLLPGFWRGES